MSRAILTPAQLCKRWQVGDRTLQRWRVEQRGPCYFKIGRTIRYPLKAVQAFEQDVLRIGTSHYKRDVSLLDAYQALAGGSQKTTLKTTQKTKR